HFLHGHCSFLLLKQSLPSEIYHTSEVKERQRCYLWLCYQLLRRDLPALIGPCQRHSRLRRSRVIEVGFVFIDQGLTIPKIKTLQQRTTRVEQVSHLVGYPFPGVFKVRVVHRGHGYCRDAHQLPLS